MFPKVRCRIGMEEYAGAVPQSVGFGEVLRPLIAELRPVRSRIKAAHYRFELPLPKRRPAGLKKWPTGDAIIAGSSTNTPTKATASMANIR